MAQIPIEIPDKRLPRLEPYQNRLSGVLSRWVTVLETVSTAGNAPVSQISGVYQEILDFLLMQPEPGIGGIGGEGDRALSHGLMIKHRLGRRLHIARKIPGYGTRP